jgi:hypothetical protein
MVFANGFLFPVKELGLLTNPSYSIRVLDATRSYMYDEVNIEDVGFPGLGFQGKNLCVMCVFAIVSFLFFY